MDAIEAHLQRGDVGDPLVFDALRMRLVEIGEAVGVLPAVLVTPRLTREGSQVRSLCRPPQESALSTREPWSNGPGSCSLRSRRELAVTDALLPRRASCLRC